MSSSPARLARAGRSGLLLRRRAPPPRLHPSSPAAPRPAGHRQRVRHPGHREHPDEPPGARHWRRAAPTARVHPRLPPRDEGCAFCLPAAAVIIMTCSGGRSPPAHLSKGAAVLRPPPAHSTACPTSRTPAPARTPPPPPCRPGHRQQRADPHRAQQLQYAAVSAEPRGPGR